MKMILENHSLEDIEYFEEHKQEFIDKVMARIEMEDLISCDNKLCGFRGEFIKCYFDIYKNCQFYKE